MHMYKQPRRKDEITFGELYAEISRDRDIKAARLQKRRWEKLSQLIGS